MKQVDRESFQKELLKHSRALKLPKEDIDEKWFEHTIFEFGFYDMAYSFEDYFENLYSEEEQLSLYERYVSDFCFLLDLSRFEISVERFLTTTDTYDILSHSLECPVVSRREARGQTQPAQEWHIAAFQSMAVADPILQLNYRIQKSNFNWYKEQFNFSANSNIHCIPEKWGNVLNESLNLTHSNLRQLTYNELQLPAVQCFNENNAYGNLQRKLVEMMAKPVPHDIEYRTLEEMMAKNQKKTYLTWLDSFNYSENSNQTKANTTDKTPSFGQIDVPILPLLQLSKVVNYYSIRRILQFGCSRNLEEAEKIQLRLQPKFATESERFAVLSTKLKFVENKKFKVPYLSIDSGLANVLWTFTTFVTQHAKPFRDIKSTELSLRWNPISERFYTSTAIHKALKVQFDRDIFSTLSCNTNTHIASSSRLEVDHPGNMNLISGCARNFSSLQNIKASPTDCYITKHSGISHAQEANPDTHTIEQSTSVMSNSELLSGNKAGSLSKSKDEFANQPEPQSTTDYIDQLLRIRKKKVVTHTSNKSQGSDEFTSIEHTLAKPNIENIPHQWFNIWKDFEIKSRIYKYIADIKILYNREVVNYLTSECRIDLLERDLGGFMISSELVEVSPQYLEADLILDEASAIVYYPLIKLSQKSTQAPDESSNAIKMFAQSLISMRYKYENVWVILEGYVKTKNSLNTYLGFDPFAPYVQEAVTELHIFVAYAQSAIDINIEILYSFSPQDSARIARIIGDITMASAEQPDPDIEYQDSQRWRFEKNWISRDWLFEEESTHERFLSSFITFNRFSTQATLTITSLRKLVGLTEEEMETLLEGWVSKSQLKLFYRLIHTPLEGQ